MQPTSDYKTILRQTAQQELERLKPRTSTPESGMDVYRRQIEPATPQIDPGRRALEDVATRRPQPMASPVPDLAPLRRAQENSSAASAQLNPSFERQNGLLSQAGQITQRFGNKNSIERFSGGINTGTDIAVPIGTKIAVPQGQWEVVESFAGADPNGGHIGNNVNRGYGNSVLVRNAQTGEMLRFSHLAAANVQAGQVLDGGMVIGLSGNSGNTTGPHLDLEYYDPRGRLADVLATPYGAALTGRRDVYGS